MRAKRSDFTPEAWEERQRLKRAKDALAFYHANKHRKVRKYYLRDSLLRAANRVAKQFREREEEKARRLKWFVFLARQRLIGTEHRRILKRLRRHFEKARGYSVSSGFILELCGISLAGLREHIAKQFKPGMSWANYGFDTWHIDHIRPCASFDLRDPEQQKKCFHYTNLQPLWAKDNLHKGSRLT